MLHGAFGEILQMSDDLSLSRSEREMYTTDSRICELTNERAVLNEIVESQRNELAFLVERVRVLTQERDEARQEICIRVCDTLGAVLSGSPRTPQDYAEKMGWDCFKEDTNDR
jgi:hypothetical protein